MVCFLFLLFFYFPISVVFLIICFGRYFGSKGIYFLTILSLFLSFILSCSLFFEVGLCSTVCELDVSGWFSFGLLEVRWSFLFDSISVGLLCLVSFISLFVQVYSTQYMSDDPHLSRFMLKLTIFSIFMFLLVCSNNFVQFLLGWEGVGISSYLLINFWFGRVLANKSALQAIILNRIGDFGLMVALVLIYFVFKTTDFLLVFNLVSLLECNFYLFSMCFLICCFLLLGAVGKSAQIGLHTWLPSAMEGPTPVSALIHSSTMVVAGIFLIIRCSKLFEFFPFVLNLICFLGALTVLLSSFLGMVQFDIKKIIAYSTCSQLGYMLFACGALNFVGSFFHLITHAFFKSLLFLCAGCVVHACSGEQDIRFMGVFRKFLPIIFLIMFVGTLALNGIFFLSGYYSKELILMSSLVYNDFFSFVCFLVIFFSIAFTSFYSFRLIYYVFFDSSQVIQRNGIKEANFLVLFCLINLYIFSILAGFFFEDLFCGIGTVFWQDSVLLNFVGVFEAEFVNFLFQIFPLFFVFWGFYLFYVFEIYVKGFPLLRFLGFELSSFGWDGFHKFISNFFVLFFSYSVFFRLLDRGFFEFFGPFGIVRFFNSFLDVIIFFVSMSFYKLLFVMFYFILCLIFVEFTSFFIGVTLSYLLFIGVFFFVAFCFKV